MWRQPYHIRIYQIYILTSISEGWQPNVHLISGQTLIYYTETTLRCFKSWMFCLIEDNKVISGIVKTITESDWKTRAHGLQCSTEKCS